MSDAVLTREIADLHQAHYVTYGARKIHSELVRTGTPRSPAHGWSA